MKFSRNLYIILALAFSVVAYGAIEEKISSDTLKMGLGNNGTDKVIEFDTGDGAANPKIKADPAAGKIQFAHDGTNFKDIGSGSGGGSGFNMISENSDAESGTANWTETGSGAFTTTATAGDVGFGDNSFSFTPAAASDVVATDSYAVPQGLDGRNCSASMIYKGGDSDIALQVFDADASNVIAEVDLETATSYVPGYIAFTCPTAGTNLQFRLFSTAGTGAQVFFDSVHLGENNKLGLVTPANEVEIIHLSANVTSDGTISELTFNDLEIGKRYRIGGHVQFDGNAVPRSSVIDFYNGGTVVGRAIFNGSDQTTSSESMMFGVNSIFTATGSTLTAEASSLAADEYIAGNGTYTSTTISLEKLNNLDGPKESLTLETTGWHIDANMGGEVVDVGTSTVSSYTTIDSSGSLDLVLNEGSKSAKIACSGTNPATGLTCASGVESVGIVFDVPTAGRYKVCTQFPYKNILNTSGSLLDTTFQLVETETDSQTILQEGKGRQSFTNRHISATTELSIGVNLCGEFTFSSSGEKAIRLAYEQRVTTAPPATNSVSIDRFSSLGQKDMHWSVEKMGEQFPTPVFTDLNNTLAKKVEATRDGMRVETCRMGGGGTFISTDTCSVWIDSTHVPSTGLRQMNISPGTFSEEPDCVASGHAGSVDGRLAQAVTSSTTRVDVYTYWLANSGSDQIDQSSESFSLVCIGKK